MKLLGKIFISTAMVLFCLTLLSFFEFTFLLPSGQTVKSDHFKGLSFLAVPFLFIGLAAEREELERKLKEYKFSLQTSLGWWMKGEPYAEKMMEKYTQELLAAKEMTKYVYEKIKAMPEKVRVKIYEKIFSEYGSKQKPMEVAGYAREREVGLTGGKLYIGQYAGIIPHEMVHIRVDEIASKEAKESLYFLPFTEGWAWCLQGIYEYGGIDEIKAWKEREWVDVKALIRTYIAEKFEEFYRRHWEGHLMITKGYDKKRAEEWSDKMIKRGNEFSDLILEIIRRKPLSVIEKAMGTDPLTLENLKKWLYVE